MYHLKYPALYGSFVVKFLYSASAIPVESSIIEFLLTVR